MGRVPKSELQAQRVQDTSALQALLNSFNFWSGRLIISRSCRSVFADRALDGSVCPTVRKAWEDVGYHRWTTEVLHPMTLVSLLLRLTLGFKSVRGLSPLPAPHDARHDIQRNEPEVVAPQKCSKDRAS